MDQITRRIKRIISLNITRRKERNAKTTRINFLKEILDQAIYMQDLFIEKKGSPVLILFTDSILFGDNLAYYNDIMMQLNRIDMKINIMDIFSSTVDNFNILSVGLIPNIELVKFIARYTLGSYQNEANLAALLGVETTNLINYKTGNEVRPERNCSRCSANLGFLLCKKPYKTEKEGDFYISRNILSHFQKFNKFDDLGLNLFAVQSVYLTRRGETA